MVDPSVLVGVFDGSTVGRFSSAYLRSSVHRSEVNDLADSNDADIRESLDQDPARTAGLPPSHQWVCFLSNS
jgi:hypothetical protein